MWEINKLKLNKENMEIGPKRTNHHLAMWQLWQFLKTFYFALTELRCEYNFLKRSHKTCAQANNTE